MYSIMVFFINSEDAQVYFPEVDYNKFKMVNDVLSQDEDLKYRFREYVLDFSIESHKEYIDICERTFMSMVYTYYHIHYLEKRFKDEYSI